MLVEISLVELAIDALANRIHGVELLKYFTSNCKVQTAEDGLPEYVEVVNVHNCSRQYLSVNIN